MKRTLGLWVAVLVLWLSGPAHAVDYDRTGVLGLNYTVGPSFIAGGSDAREAGTVEPGVGAGLQLGISSNLDLTLSYDYLDADLRTQALTFGGQWRFGFQRGLSPFAGAGIGFGKPYSGEGWDHFSLKLLGGLEKPLTDSVSLAATLTYHYVEGPDPLGSVHALEPGIRVIFSFGALRLPR